MKRRSPLASAASFIHKFYATEVDLIKRTALLYNKTKAIHKWVSHETQDPRDSGSLVPTSPLCERVCVCVRGMMVPEGAIVVVSKSNFILQS